jgi:hypothetical protein
VKTLFLQVYIPTTYTSPSDQLDLGTLWVAYIPTDQVDPLAAMIKAKQSKFYSSVSITAAKQLAARVMPGWGIRGTVSLNGDGSSSGGGGATVVSGTGAAADAGQNARRDAIIGVVSSLGAIALLVLVVLIVHSVKRRRDMAHRRLLDQASVGGSSSSGEDVGGREFDRDSVGMPRRRSFYFAEDSLRGYEAERDREATELGLQAGGSQGGRPGMTQRKVGPIVVPGSISAPILRESSMNW